MAEPKYLIMLFQNVTEAMKAEKLLMGSGIVYKLIPVPRSISSQCGICLRFSAEDKEGALAMISGKLDYGQVVEFPEAKS